MHEWMSLTVQWWEYAWLSKKLALEIKWINKWVDFQMLSKKCSNCNEFLNAAANFINGQIKQNLILCRCTKNELRY